MEKAWENSRHVRILPRVSPRNDVWGMSTEIPFLWCISIQIWVELLIGRPISTTTQIWVATFHQNGISTVVPQMPFCWETSNNIAKRILPRVSPRNDVWGMSTEIPFLWCISIQIWVELLIGRPISTTTQIWVATCHQNGISTVVPQTPFYWETSNSIAKRRLFS